MSDLPIINCSQYADGYCRKVQELVGIRWLVRDPRICEHCLKQGTGGVLRNGKPTKVVSDQVRLAQTLNLAPRDGAGVRRYQGKLVGDYFHDLLAERYELPTGCGNCDATRKAMNDNGTQWCRDNAVEIATGVYKRAKRWVVRDASWADTLKAAKDVVLGALKLKGPVRLIAEMVVKACEIAEAAGPPRPFARSVGEINAAADIIITCGPKYAVFLDEAIQSAISQSYPSVNVTVVADNCPDAAGIVARYEGVRLIEGNYGHPHRSRRAGYESTDAHLVCFLDADDTLPPEYIDEAAKLFDAGPLTAIVHSDWKRFGDSDAVSHFPQRIEFRDLLRTNHIHSGAVTLRAVVDIAQAMDGELRPDAWEDWRMWRNILAAGYRSVKSPALYGYRKHSESRTATSTWTWAGGYGMSSETVPLLIPLSGREWAWPDFSDWLDTQTWPHDQIELRLLDTSQDDEFHETVREWVRRCDYRNVLLNRASVAAPGLADRPRSGEAGTQALVNSTMLRIWRILSDGLTRPFAITIEDDLVPPIDAIEQMLMQFTSGVDAVALPYRHRFRDGKTIPDGPVGTAEWELASWCAFGCTAWRTDVLQSMRETPRILSQWYDVAATKGREIMVGWHLECLHKDKP